MESESKARKSDKKALGQLIVRPVFDVLSIQNEISSSFAPILRQQELMWQFFQQNADVIQNLVKQMNHALETYRSVFETFGKLQEQINSIQKERVAIARSLTHVASLWNQFTLRVPKEKNTERATLISHRNITLSSETIEVITDKVFERIEKRAKENQVKLIGEQHHDLIQLPQNCHWESIAFEFKDEFEAVIKNGKTLVGRFNLEELGFSKKNTRDKKANKPWNFLLALSACKVGKGVDPTVDTLIEGGRFGNKNALHATKTILSKHLEQIFGIDEEPFFPYAEYGYYKTKFTLVPPVAIRGGGEVFLTKGNGFNENPQIEDALY